MPRQSNILNPVNDTPPFSRRAFIGLIPAAALAQEAKPVIDIHQHTNYGGRTDQELIGHQRAMGVTETVLLPAGSKYGLRPAVEEMTRSSHSRRPTLGNSFYFANELPDIPETKSVLEKFLKAGAIGIGEQKFHVECDSKSMQLVADIARRSRRAPTDAFPAQCV